MGLLTPRTSPFHRIGDRYATLFDLDHFLGRNAFEDGWMTKAPKNVREEKDAILIEIAVPGFDKDEVSVEAKDSMLTITAKKKVEPENYVEKQVPTQLEPQVIQLDPDVGENGITAELKNGMLYIRIPYSSKPDHQSRTIKVV